MKTLRQLLSVLLAAWMLFGLVSCGQTTESVYADSVFTGMDTAITLRLARDGGSWV